jgi:transcriptional regulator with XRE-family HTH domain
MDTSEVVTAALTAGAVGGLKDYLARMREGNRSTAIALERIYDDPDYDPGVTFAEALSALRAAAGIPLRALTPKVGKSAATLSRIFSGKILPTRSLLMSILAALEAPAATGQQIMQLWAAAMSANAGPTKPKVAPAMEGEQETDIIVHGGSIMFTDKAATSGRIITIHAGEVLFSPAAARAARQIIVHGGAVEIGNQPSSHSSQRDDEANRDGEDPPATGGHLRVVS